MHPFFVWLGFVFLSFCFSAKNLSLYFILKFRLKLYINFRRARITTKRLSPNVHVVWILSTLYFPYSTALIIRDAHAGL